MGTCAKGELVLGRQHSLCKGPVAGKRLTGSENEKESQHSPQGALGRACGLRGGKSLGLFPDASVVL